MKTYTGGETVKGGYFLNLRDWKLEVLEGNTGTLPGDGVVRYLRVPTLAMIAVAPVMGLMFVVLLPFIGLAVIGERGLTQVRALFGARPAEGTKATTNPRQ